MSQDSDFEMVKASPLAPELTDDECRSLANVVSHRRLNSGEMLLEEGATDHSLFVVLSGRVEVVKDTGGGDRVVLHTYKAGDMVGELGFIDGTPHSAGLCADGETEVLALERDAFEALLASQPVLVYKVMKAIVRTVHVILRRMNVQYVELTNYITKAHGKY